MTDSLTLPGAPNLGEFIAMHTDPDLAIKGIIFLDGDDLPPDRTIGRMVRTKITTPGEYIETEWFSRRVIVIDTSRPHLIPESLRTADEADLYDILHASRYDIYVNLLSGGDDGELGETVRTTLTEPETCYDPGVDDIVPGYHDPLDDDTAYPGEQRAYVVINGS